MPPDMKSAIEDVMKQPNRKVVIEATFTVIASVPESFATDEIEFLYGQSSWCANNLLKELNRYAEKEGCVCSLFKSKFIRDATPEDEEEFGASII